MTKEEFEKYRKINNEITAIKKFLSFCGTKKYRRVDNHPFSLRAFKPVKKHRNPFELHIKHLMPIEYLDEADIPDDLQDRIIEVIEEYVEEKEKELDEL